MIVLFVKQFRVTSQTGEPYLEVSVINPDKEKVVLHMAFHESLIVTLQHVWLVVFRHNPTFFKVIQHDMKMLYLHRIMPIPLQVLLELAGILQCPGHPIKGLLQIP